MSDALPTVELEYLRVDDTLVARLGVKKSRIYQMIRSGDLPSVRWGDKRGGVRIPRRAFEEWVAQHADEAMEAVRK